jgi:hypothetical protein
MGNVSTPVIGLLLLVPIVLGIVIAYLAIKCSEWHIWKAHHLIGRHRRDKSRSDTSTNTVRSSVSVSLERGLVVPETTEFA